jgi:hypothetical protein
MLRGDWGVALLRHDYDLWSLGGAQVAFLRLGDGPNSVGATILWHFCDFFLAPSGKQCPDTSAFSQ